MTRAKKSFGQHFLIDSSVAKRMVAAADISFVQTVVEVGPGTGALTKEIVSAFSPLPEGGGSKRLVLIEADRDLLATLTSQFPQAEIVQADAATVSFDELVQGPWIFLSNLPYNAGNAIIKNVLTSKHPPVQLIVMLQKEVADRVLALPGHMSVLTVATNLYAVPKRLFNVKPGAFSPPPKVQSSVLELRPRPYPGVSDPERVMALVKVGFSSKRKQLHRNFADAGVAESERVKEILVSMKKLPTVRAQELSLDDWVALSAML